MMPKEVIHSRDTYSYLKDIIPNTSQQEKAGNMTTPSQKVLASHRSRSGQGREQPFLSTPQPNLQNAAKNYQVAQKSLHEHN